MALFQGQATRVIVREPEEIKVEKILTPKTDAPGSKWAPPYTATFLLCTSDSQSTESSQYVRK
jgi:hypothetical protein